MFILKLRNFRRCKLWSSNVQHSRQALPKQYLHSDHANHLLMPRSCAGPNSDQVAKFKSQLSSPDALVYQPSYQYAAGLITDGLSNGTEPVYVLPTPR